MTLQERIEALADDNGLSPSRTIKSQVLTQLREAVLQEREECAKEAEQHFGYSIKASQEIAGAIRARKEPA